MLTQYRLLLSANRACRPRPEWGYRLYAALLEDAPAELGLGVHNDAVTPVSQYLTVCEDCVFWTVNLLGDRCWRDLGPVL